MPASIEESVWSYYSVKAEERGMELSELLTEVPRRDIEIHEALKQADCSRRAGVKEQDWPPMNAD